MLSILLYAFFILFLLVVASFVIYFLLFYGGSTYIKEAKEYFRASLYDKAIEMCLKELETNPQSIEAHLLLGEIYFEKKYYEAARDEFEEVLRLKENKPFPEEPEVIKKLLDIYNNLNDKSREYLTLLKAVFLFPDDNQLRLRLAEFLIGNGKIEDALQQLNIILEKEPANIQALFLKGILSLKRNKEEGIEILEALIKINTQFVPAYEILGYLYIDIDVNKAIKYFQITRGLTKELIIRANASVMLAYLYSISKNWKKMILELEPLLSFMDRFDVELSSEIYFALGLAYLFSNNEEKADEYLRSLVKINFQYMDIYETFQLKRTTTLGKKQLLDYWNLHFQTKTFRNPLDELVVYKLKNIKDIEEKYLSWLQARGGGEEQMAVKKESSGNEVVELDFPKPKNHIELSQLPIFQFRQVVKKMLQKLNYIISKEIDSKEGFDAIIVKNIGDPPIYMISRNWVGQIGEIPVEQMLAEMEKMDYRKGMLICCGEFSEDAKKIAENGKIKLIGASTVDRILRQI